MILRWLEVENFRNLHPGRVAFGPGVNLLWGSNGAGKSNLLEAAYFLLTTRSFRTSRSTEIVRQGAAGLRVAGELEGRGGRNRLEAVQGGGKKAVYLDGKKVGLEEILRRYSVLAFSSDQMNVFRGGPRDRRRFLDRGILALRPAYLRELGDLFRSLAQRNRLLRDGVSGTELAAWTERFVAAGARVAAAREGYVALLSGAVGERAGELLPDGAKLALEYRPGHGGSGRIGESSIDAAAAAMRRALERSGGAELRRGHTLVGPHRDELQIRLAGSDLSRFGSAGQQRAALLALKLTRLELYREQAGEAPLLLVDDMDSDLDDAASERLLARVGRSQTLVTTCKKGSRERQRPGSRTYRVRNGEITPDDRGTPAESAGAGGARDGAL